MIKKTYTYVRMILASLLFIFLLFNNESVKAAFLAVVMIFTISIPLKRVLESDSMTYFETKLNYFLDEFFVYGAVLVLSRSDIAPIWVAITYFFKDATIGAIRNFAIKNDEPLKEKIGYKTDKFVQYCVILTGALYSAKVASFISAETVRYLFYASAVISMLTLSLFFFSNRGFMKRIHDS